MISNFLLLQFNNSICFFKIEPVGLPTEMFNFQKTSILYILISFPPKMQSLGRNQNERGVLLKRTKSSDIRNS